MVMAKVLLKERKMKNITRDKLLMLDKEELVDKILQLEAHNYQLKNIISKNCEENKNEGNKRKKPFDFTKSYSRPILLHLQYFGWDYQGYVVQEDSTNTVEHHLFQALTKACLIESRETAQYHRCGRTDKGVSAFGQVISITLRSKLPPEQQKYEEYFDNELPYCKILNRLLPKEIRAVKWMPIPQEKPDFSARFDCKKRQYKYYFPKSSLNINEMREAASLLVGSHDFRNLCKMDVGNGVTEFVREIKRADIICVDNKNMDQPTSMYYLLIEGNAFLWHQIRCIMAVLLLIGSGKETKDVINNLLDHNTNNRKPQYNMAIDVPLNLFECSYELNNRWVYDEDELANVVTGMQKDWTLFNIKATMIKDCIDHLEASYADIEQKKGIKDTITNESEQDSNRAQKTETENVIETKNKEGESKVETQDVVINKSKRDRIIAYHECLTQGVKPKKYTPLMKRGTCSSLEEKIEYYKKRRKPNSTEKTC